MKTRSRALPFLALAGLALITSACGSGAAAGAAPAATSGAPAPLADASLPLADATLAPWRRELLDLAFRSASSMPLFPHVKNRSRAQEEVVDACLELEQLQRARRCADQIANWRRGAVLADLAFHQARAGDAAGAEASLALARTVADEVAQRVAASSGAEDALESAQDWQRDRIRAKIASVHLALGQHDAAAAVETDLVASELGELWEARAVHADDASFDDEMESLEAAVATGDFERTCAALDSCVRLYDRYFADAARRERVEKLVASSGGRLPPEVRIGVHEHMAEAALAHDDRSAALRSLEAAQEILDDTRWDTEHFIALSAGLAALRHRAGQVDTALRTLEAALARYDAERDQIVNIYRATALRALAEALQTMGDGARSLAVYRRAVEEGTGNPNSRPRADDLTTTACSMALHGVEPDAALWARMNGICEALRDPW